MIQELKAADVPRLTRNRSLAMNDSDYARLSMIADYYGTTKSDALRTMIRYFEVHLKIGGQIKSNVQRKHGGGGQPRDKSHSGSGGSTGDDGADSGDSGADA